MSVSPLPRTIQFLIKDYADDRQVEALFFPEIFVTGSVFKSAMEERVLDPQNPQEYYQKVFKQITDDLKESQPKIKISETLQNLIKDEVFHTQRGPIVVTLVDKDYRDEMNRGTLKVWREGVTKPLSVFNSSDIRSATILEDLSGIVVVCGRRVFYQTLDGMNQTEINVPQKNVLEQHQIEVTDTLLSFINHRLDETTTLFQFPIKGPFNEPKRIEFQNIRRARFDPQTNRVFYQSCNDNSLNLFDVTTMRNKKLSTCDGEDYSQFSSLTLVYDIQGNIIVMTDGSQITIYNFETDEVLRQFKPQDQLPSQTLRIDNFKDFKITLVRYISSELLAFSQLTFAES